MANRTRAQQAAVRDTACVPPIMAALNASSETWGWKMRCQAEGDGRHWEGASDGDDQPARDRSGRRLATAAPPTTQCR
jgi:hypothetical protein